MQSWQAGADVLAFDLVASDGASLLPWSERDPLVRPKSYRAAVDTFAWRPEALALLAREAHSRGVIVHGVLDPQPVTDRSTERLATLRFYARELADRRRLQAGAFDGFAVRDWFADREALGMAMLQDFQPAARFVLVGEQAMTAAVGVKALDARDGQPAGLYASGISDAFRNGFPGDLVPVGLLDARAAAFAGWWRWQRRRLDCGASRGFCARTAFQRWRDVVVGAGSSIARRRHSSLCRRRINGAAGRRCGRTLQHDWRRWLPRCAATVAAKDAAGLWR